MPLSRYTRVKKQLLLRNVIGKITLTSPNVINVSTTASLSFHEVSVPLVWLLAGLFRLSAEMLVVERHRMYWLDVIDLFIIRTLR